jgi:hypothetical protein
MHGHRLSRQFHKSLDKLREIQAVRRETEERDLKRAAGILELHKHKGIPYDPAADGFVFSNAEIETHSQRLIRLNEARHIEYIRFHAPPQTRRAGLTAAASNHLKQFCIPLTMRATLLLAITLALDFSNTRKGVRGDS